MVVEQVSLSEIIGEKVNTADLSILPIDFSKFEPVYYLCNYIKESNGKKFQPVKIYKENLVASAMYFYVRRPEVLDRFSGLIREFSRQPEQSFVFSLEADSRVIGEGTSQRYGDRIYLDGEYAFVLKRNYYPIAVVSFNTDENMIDIKQLQGVKGEEKALQLFNRWEKMLVLIAEDYARFSKLEEARIRPASKNGWVLVGKLSPEMAKLRYDVTAKRCGYHYDDLLERYVKFLV